MWQIINQYICAVIMMIGVYYFGKISLNTNNKISKEKFCILLQIIYIIHMITYIKTGGIIKTIIMFFTNTIFYKFTFNIFFSKAILLSFIYMIILLIPDLMELFFVTKILNMPIELCYNSFAGSIISNIIICISVILICKIIKEKIRNLILVEIDSNKNILLYSLMTFLCVGLLFYSIINKYKFSNDIIIYLISILLLVIVFFSLMKQMIVNKKITKEYDDLLQFMITYEREIENQRILRHEIKNEFRTIRAKICDNQENKEIVEYIDEIVNDKYEINKEKYAKFGYLPPNGIKGLFYFKTQEAENKGIKVSINISKKLKNSTIYKLSVKQQRDFGRIIGVFLDNAIEASVETKEKQIGVEVYVNDKGEVKLIISNTYNNQIDKTKLGIESFSTKGNARGHGLLLVKQLVNKNNVFDIKTEIQNNIYIQILEIKKIIED